MSVALYKKGDAVVKTSGYVFPGYIVCAFYTPAGKLRYVVDHATSEGLLHIFNEEQIASAPVESWDGLAEAVRHIKECVDSFDPEPIQPAEKWSVCVPIVHLQALAMAFTNAKSAPPAEASGAER